MLSVVIPMYNGTAVIGPTVRALRAYFEKEAVPYQLVIVSDGSTDGGERTAKALLGEADKLICYTPNRGKGYAMKRGAAEAAGELLLFVDADLAYGTEPIGRALALQDAEHADIVIGSRHLSKDAFDAYPLSRRIASRGFSLAVRLCCGVRQSDTQCGFKLYTKAAADAIFPQLTVDRFAADLEILYLAEREKFCICEMPVSIRAHGASTVRLLRDSAVMLADACKIRHRHRQK